MKRLTAILITATAAAVLATPAPAYVIDPTPGWDTPLVLKVKLAAKVATVQKSKKFTGGGVSIPKNKPVLQIEP